MYHRTQWQYLQNGHNYGYPTRDDCILLRSLQCPHKRCHPTISGLVALWANETPFVQLCRVDHCQHNCAQSRTSQTLIGYKLRFRNSHRCDHNHHRWCPRRRCDIFPLCLSRNCRHLRCGDRLQLELCMYVVLKSNFWFWINVLQIDPSIPALIPCVDADKTNNNVNIFGGNWWINSNRMFN